MTAPGWEDRDGKQGSGMLSHKGREREWGQTALLWWLGLALLLLWGFWYFRSRTTKWERHVRKPQVPPMIRMTVTPYDWGDDPERPVRSRQPGTFVIDRLNFPPAECLTHEVLGPTWFRTYFCADFQARFVVLQEGTFEFQLRADDAFELRLDGVRLMGRTRYENFEIVRGTKFLNAGTHRMNVAYFQSVGSCGIIGHYRPADAPPDRLWEIGVSSEFIRFQEQRVAPEEIYASEAEEAPGGDAPCRLPAQGLKLTEIPPLFCFQEWGSLRYGRTLNGTIFRIAGTDYDVPGLGTHARSILVYDVSSYGGCVFSARVGRDEVARDPLGRIKPQVLLDGQVLVDGPALSSADPPATLEVPLHGQRLSLVVLDADDGVNCDHTDWLEPTLKPRLPESSEASPAESERQP